MPATCSENDNNDTMACYEDISGLTSGSVLVQTTLVTLLVTCVFMATKTSYDTFRQRWSRATVIVIGAGPVGLTSVLISALSGKAHKITLFDDRFRNELINRPQQIALKDKCVKFLKTLGVDFDNIEGCWHQGCFFTKLGVFQEYMLGMVYRLHAKVSVDIRLNTKVSAFAFSYFKPLRVHVFTFFCNRLESQTLVRGPANRILTVGPSSPDTM